MAARQTLHPHDVLTVERPRLAGIEVVFRVTSLAPQNQCWAADLASRLEIGLVHLEVERRARAVVFADPVNLFRRAYAHVLDDLLFREAALPYPVSHQLLADVVLLVAAQQPFRKIKRLRE